MSFERGNSFAAKQFMVQQRSPSKVGLLFFMAAWQKRCGCAAGNKILHTPFAEGATWAAEGTGAASGNRLFLLGGRGAAAELFAGADAEHACGIAIWATFGLQPAAQATFMYVFYEFVFWLFWQSTGIEQIKHQRGRWHGGCLVVPVFL